MSRIISACNNCLNQFSVPVVDWEHRFISFEFKYIYVVIRKYTIFFVYFLEFSLFMFIIFIIFVTPNFFLK
jgi:hypothetical protein